MFQQFMQMGMAASIALVGMSMAMAGVAIAIIVRGQSERTAQRKYELDRIGIASKAKLVEHKHKQEE